MEPSLENDDFPFDALAGSSSSPIGPTDDLNEPQRQAVLHVEGPLLVFAGAGSGKTRVITYRIANLVATHRVPPYRILAVTFTNKAAGEMRRRIEGLIGADVTRDLWVGTFHATCARLLRRHHEAAGLSRSFVIYDDADQRAVMNRILKEFELDDRRYPARQVLGRIHKEKQEGRGPGDFQPDSYVDDAIVKCFAEYQRRLSEANAVDFEDLLLAVMRIAEDRTSAAGEELRRKFSYVLVDEFQDVNLIQYRLVRAFAAATQNLCVVGDDDQSIYRWRGADVRNIRNFRKDFPSAVVIKLEQNYRSTGNVVKAALAVIKPAKDREPKQLFTDRPAGAAIPIVTTQNERDEAAWVVSEVRALIARGISPREIAIFYRVHAQSRVLEEVMRQERVPYQIIGGTRFFERAEIKDFLSYLRVITNPRSDVDLLRIINVPARKIGQSTVDRLITMADSMRCSLFDAVVPLASSGNAGSAAKKSLLGFSDLLQALMREAATASPRTLAEDVLQRTGYAQHLKDEDSAQSDARLLNLEELLGFIEEYEEEIANAGEEATLAGYLERVTLQSDADTLEDVPKVAMMTVHGAKGLEFHAVFLTGMEEEMFPFRGLDPEHADELEEERRLAYVAITRAREHLSITHAAMRMIFGKTRYGMPSRFLRDLPRSAIDPRTTPAAAMFLRRPETPAPSSTRSGPWTHPSERSSEFATKRVETPRRASGDAPAWAVPQAAIARDPGRAPGERYIEHDEVEGEGLRVGGRVTHAKYGVGIVRSIDDGTDPIVTVRFSSGWGEKRIKSTYLRLP